MRTLVTGASGFVASHVVRALIAAGQQEIMATDLAAPPAPTLAQWVDAGVSFSTLDVTDTASVLEIIAKYRPENVIHAAAITPDNLEEAGFPGQIVSVNTSGTANVVDALLKIGGLNRLVMFSSSGVYNGLQTYPDPIPEDIPLPSPPASLYAVTKIAVEGMAERAVAAGLMSAVAVRVANVYGTFERATNSRRAPRLSLIHKLARATADSLPVRCGDANAGRDWIHGDDVGRAIVMLLDAPRLDHIVYNVASGHMARWQDIISMFRSEGLVISNAAEATEIAMRTEDHRPALNIKRLTQTTGFKPTVTLQHGIHELVAHHRNELTA